MAINDNTNANTNANTANRYINNTLGSVAQTTDKAVPRESSYSLFGTGTTFGAGISRNLGSEYTNNFVKKLNEAMLNLADPNIKFKAVIIDREECNIRYSCLGIVAQEVVRPDVVSVFTLILEATNEDPGSIYENIGNANTEIIRTTEEAYDDIVKTAVANKVAQNFPGTKIIQVESMVIPRDFNLDNNVLVHRVLFNSGLATVTELKVSSPDFVDPSIPTGNIDVNLLLNVQFGMNNHDSVVGTPIRGDIVVDFSTKERQQQRSRSINDVSRERKLSTVTGYVELMWAPSVNTHQNNFYGAPQNNATQKYLANFVLTDVVSDRAYTPASLLMALYTALAVRDSNNWVQAFKPSNVQGLDIRDIGALNIEANLPRVGQLPGQVTEYGDRVDTKISTFGISELGQYVTALVQPGLVLSLDVQLAGPNTWYLTMFKEAANGNPYASDVIINSANTLTRGLFSKHFQSGTPIFVQGNEFIHMGYYTDRNGVRKDLRDIDYVAVANILGDRDPTMLRAWSDTFIYTDYNPLIRLNARMKIIKGCTGDSAVFTGIATRVTFTGAFLNALAASIRESGISVDITTPMNTSEYYNTRGNALNYMQDAMLTQNNMFNQHVNNYSGYAGNTNIYQGTSRYQR